MKRKIGMISPAYNLLKVFPNRKREGIKNLKEIFMEPIFAKNAVRKTNSVEDRLKELEEILDQEEDLIMATMGGHTSIQLIEKINYKKIKEKNIPFCGFSDITALLLAIYSKTKIEMLYGPVYTVNICEVGGMDGYTKKYLLDTLEGKEFTYEPSTYQIKEFIDWKDQEISPKIRDRVPKEYDWITIQEGKVEGKLIGGNLATLLLILGTEYLPVEEFQDSILFIEDCDTNIDEFTSYLESLKLKGVLSKVKGIIIGKFDTDDLNNKIEDFLKDYFNDSPIPIACNLDFGHVFPIMTLPIGRKATLECTKNKVLLTLNKKI